MSAVRHSPPEAATERRAPRHLGRHALAVPSLTLWLLLFVAPLAVLIAYSFGQIDIITYTVDWGWTTENYRRIFDDVYLSTIVRSFALALGATVACLVIGFPVAYCISRQPARLQQLLLIAIVVPFWTSFVVRTYAWVNILKNGGPLEGALQKLGLLNGSLDLLYTPASVIIGVTYTYLPLMILPLFVALERIDPSLRHAASDLGATGWRVFLRVTVPLAVPGIVAGCVLVGVPATGEYVVPAILGGGKTLMYGNVVADQFLTVGDYPFGSALAASLMAVLTVVLVVTRRRAAELEAVA